MIDKSFPVLVFLTILGPDWSTALNNRPIIGVLAQEISNSSHGDTSIPSSYFKWLEAGGCRTVPIRVKEPLSYYEQLLPSINGVLFPGGGSNILTSEYAKAARIIYGYALKANDKGDYFPLWGTCLGFQLLTALTSGQNLLSDYDAEDLPLPLNLTTDYKESRMFGNLPADVLKIITTENVTANYHHYGLSPTTYFDNSPLKKFYRVMSTNKDRKGKTFISTVEARNYPIYGTQWHAEVNSYLWRVDYNINHGSDAVRIAQYFTDFIVKEAINYPFYGTQWHPEKDGYIWTATYHLNHGSDAIRATQHFADFFVNEARKSNHRFPDFESEVNSLINNYHPVFYKDKTFEEIYYFNYRKTRN